MKNVVLPLLLALLVIGCLVWGMAGPDGNAGDVIDGPSGTTNGSPIDPLTGGPRRGGDGPDRVPDDGTDPRRQIGGGTLVTVTGRCIGAKIELPLSGCGVTLATKAHRFRSGTDRGDQTITSARAFTGPDGRFSAQIRVPDRHAIVLTTNMRGRAEVSGNLVGARGTIDTGDIKIPAGAKLEARVVDEEGRPQPGIALRLFRPAAGKRPRFATRNWINVTSDAGGAVAPDAHLVCGRWRLGTTGFIKLIEPAGGFDIAEGQPVHQLKIVVQPPDPKALITGTVVDPEGEPVARVAVQAKGSTSWPTGYGFTNAEGRFEVRCRRDPEEEVRLAIPRAVGFDNFETTETYAWGSTDVVLTLRRAGDMTVTVIEADTEQPIEDFRVSWFRVAKGAFGNAQGKRGKVEHYPDGRATIEGVPEGTIRVVVTPRRDDLAPNEPVEVVKGGGNAELRVELRRRVDLPVRVLLRNGQPVAGTKLELMRPLDGKPVTLNSYGLELSRYAQLLHRGSYTLKLDTATTDATGRAILRWPASSTALAIRVLGPGHVPMVQERVIILEPVRLVEITVGAGATLSGIVRPLAVLQQLGLGKSDKRFPGRGPSIVLNFAGEAITDKNAPRGAWRRKTARLDAAGRFQIVGLHPGTWKIEFRVSSSGFRQASGGGSKTFPPLVLANDEKRTVEYDISDVRPATLTGQVFLNHAPATNTRIHLVRVKKGDRGAFAWASDTILSTDATGTFTANGVHPGRYRVSVDASGGRARRGTRLACPDTVDIAPGTEVSHIFRIASGKLHVRIKDSAGKPVTHLYCVAQNPGSGFRTGGQTDSAGLLEIDPIAVGTYAITTHRTPPKPVRPGTRIGAQPQMMTLGTVTVSRGPAVSSFELTKPDS